MLSTNAKPSFININVSATILCSTNDVISVYGLVDSSDSSGNQRFAGGSATDPNTNFFGYKSVTAC